MNTLFSRTALLCAATVSVLAGCSRGTACHESADPSDLGAEVIDSCFIYADNSVIESCHASTLVETSDGLLASWFGGSREGRPDVCIYTSRFDGAAWSVPEIAADGIETDYVRNPTWNPVLYRMDDGRIVLYYKVGPSASRWVGDYKVSEDEGRSWSPRRKIPDNLLGPIKNKPVTLSDGDILYPTSVEFDGVWHVYMEKSGQDFSDWRKIPVENGRFNAIQPAILRHSDGRIQILCRTRDSVVVQSWSADNGDSWSEMEATSLPNNNSGLDAVTTASGVHLLIYNPITKGRNKLALAGSHDGEHWKDLIILEDNPDPDAEYSYPAIIEGSDGTIYVSYTYRRRLVKFARVSLSASSTEGQI